jgi:hypothetical protein
MFSWKNKLLRIVAALRRKKFQQALDMTARRLIYLSARLSIHSVFPCVLKLKSALKGIFSQDYQR